MAKRQEGRTGNEKEKKEKKTRRRRIVGVQRKAIKTRSFLLELDHE